VILHKIPEGVTIASVMVAAGAGRRRAMMASAMLAVATLLGAAVMRELGPWKATALGLSCGIAVYVAATDLIPEINKRDEREFSVSALFGIILYFGVHWLMQALGLHA
jgi:ZIP family zinc transporter/zinc and cadmium transporter